MLIRSAHDVPGPFRQRGEEELLPGDVLFEGEANHHRRTDRGWSYWVSVVDNNGDLLRAKSGEFGELRKRMKAAGLPAALLMGSGDIAAMVRIAHAVRTGVLPEPNGNWAGLHREGVVPSVGIPHEGVQDSSLEGGRADA